MNDERTGAGHATGPLKHFCSAVLDVLNAPAESRPLLGGLWAELPRGVADASQSVAAELRRELHVWDAALDQLGLLTRSRHIDAGDGAAEMLADLRRTRELAGRVADALESLRHPVVLVPPTPA